MSLRVVNFGSSKTGLGTVGYTIYGVDGSTIASRSTTGVVELGSSGVYTANISLPTYDAIVLWDTGEATPRYATEDYQHSIDYIGGEVAKIQKIWNSIKNQGEFMAKLMEKLGLLQKNEGLQKVDQKIDVLSQREPPPSLTNIEEAFERKIKSVKLTVKPNVQMPEVKIPDYTSLINDIKSIVLSIGKEVVKIPKSQKEYSGNFKSVLEALDALAGKINTNVDQQSGDLATEVKKLQSVFSKMNSVLVKIGEFQERLNKLDENDKDIIKSREKIAQDIKRLNQYIYDFISSPYVKEAKDGSSIYMALAHKR